MKVTFYTYRPVQFRGIHEAAEKIKSQFMNNGGLPTREGFVPVKDNGTVIIENYYEGGKDKTDFSKMGNGRSSAAAEGALSGATTGTAIEGTKSVAKKFKNGHEEIEKPQEGSIDTDDASSVNLLDEEGEAESAAKATDPDSELSSEIDNEPEIDKPISEIENTEGLDEGLNGVDIDIPEDIEGPGGDIDLGPEIEIEPDIDVDIDIFDVI